MKTKNIAISEDITDYAGAEEETGSPRGTIYSWVSQGRIPHFRIGKRCVRFSRKVLREWLNSHKVEIAQINQNKKRGF